MKKRQFIAIAASGLVMDGSYVGAKSVTKMVEWVTPIEKMPVEWVAPPEKIPTEKIPVKEETTQTGRQPVEETILAMRAAGIDNLKISREYVLKDTNPVQGVAKAVWDGTKTITGTVYVLNSSEQIYIDCKRGLMKQSPERLPENQKANVINSACNFLTPEHIAEFTGEKAADLSKTFSTFYNSPYAK